MKLARQSANNHLKYAYLNTISLLSV
jgi:hypothetical protein